MPSRHKQRCTAPGCTVAVVAGRCDKHRRHHSQQRLTWTELYGPDWPRRRLEFLLKHPRCALCPRQARIPDHYPTPLRRLIERNEVNPHHDRYLRPLCWPCHSRETARHQPGGFVTRGA